MTRTDVHAPSSVDFDPEAYDCYGVFDNNPEWGVSETGPAVRALVDRGFRFGAGSSTQCGHCGARIRYAALMVREDIKQFIFVGETCLDNRFEALTKGEFQALREAARLNRERATKAQRLEALYAEHPVLVWGTYLRNIAEAGGVLVHIDGNGEVTQDEVDGFWVTAQVRGGFEQATRTGWEFSTLADIHNKAIRYFEPSDKQVAFFDSLLIRLDEKATTLAAREAEAAALAAAGVKVPTGRVLVEGTVLSTKWVDNQYGGSLKMLVQNSAGWKVWGTVPSAIEVDKGDVVRFTATVEASNDDALFGFYKRPTKAEVVTVAAA